MSRRPTLRDVSRASGLSTYTVSRALSNAEGVSAASRELVHKKARELGYVPNRAAQELRRNTRSSIAVLTASTSNYYYIDLMNGIQRTLQPTGRTAVIADIAAGGAYTPEQEDATVQALVEARTAGVISTLTLSRQNTRLLQDWDIPVAFVDSMPPETDRQVPSITMDNFAGSTVVAEHLVEHGYDDWLLLAYPTRWSTRHERERGLREAAERHGVALTVVESENDPASAYAALTAHLDAPDTSTPRVVIASNNTTLHGALSAVRDRALRIPDDVAIVAYDEFAWAPLLDPPLTVLDEDSQRIGVLVAEILTRVIDDQVRAERGGSAPTPVYRPEDRVVVDAELIIRRSCGC